MRELPLKQKVAMMLPYLQRAGLVSSPPPCSVGPLLSRIIEAAGDRLKVCGDIIAYADFFFTEDFQYDQKAVEKQLKSPGAAELLTRFKERLATLEPFDNPSLEQGLQQFVAAEGIQMGDIIHALRVAVTGKPVGPGLYDCLSILGKERCLTRIEKALGRAAS
jgi:glutamyl-tRNA synthetase